jgi:hypothetical protein
MALTTKRPKFAADQLVVCVESYGTSTNDESGGCAAGVRLLGSHAKVRQRPQFFIDADAPHDEIERQRRSLYPTNEAFRV